MWNYKAAGDIGPGLKKISRSYLQALRERDFFVSAVVFRPWT
jgi:hypothetical protein